MSEAYRRGSVIKCGVCGKDLVQYNRKHLLHLECSPKHMRTRASGRKLAELQKATRKIAPPEEKRPADPRTFSPMRPVELYLHGYRSVADQIGFPSWWAGTMLPTLKIVSRPS